MRTIDTIKQNFCRLSPALTFCLLILLAASFSSCKKEGCTDPAAINYNEDAKKSCDDCCEYPDVADVKVNLSHEVDGEPLVLNEMNFTNPFGRQYEVVRLRYYISDFQFHRSDGSTYDSDMYQYVDASDSSTFSFTIPDVPSGDYTSISFYFGLDEEKNQDGALPDEALRNMEWPIEPGVGYHYMQQEGFYIDSAGSETAFNTHMGTKRVDSTSYEHNYVTIDLNNSDVSLDYRTATLDISMNINDWYQNPHDYDFPRFGQMIMGNPQAQQTLHDNGADVFTLKSLNVNE